MRRIKSLFSAAPGGINRTPALPAARKAAHNRIAAVKAEAFGHLRRF